MADPLRHGLVTTVRPDGSRLTETTYEHGIAHGPYRDYWPDGLLACEGQYVNGLQEGEWRFYNPDGTLVVIQFEGGQEVVDWDHFFGRTGRRTEPDDSRPADH